MAWQHIGDFKIGVEDELVVQNYLLLTRCLLKHKKESAKFSKQLANVCFLWQTNQISYDRQHETCGCFKI